MKKFIVLLMLLSLLPGCNSDDSNNNNQFLPNYNFSIDINMQLPLYSQLQFPSNPLLITQAGIGINGIIVMNTGSGYSAYEASCPNQQLSSCSRLTIEGVTAVCPCDESVFSLFNGDGNQRYPLRAYRVEVISPSIIRVYN